MATGDVTLSIAVEGGVTKTVTLASAIRVKSKLGVNISSDADWQVRTINRMGGIVLHQANKRLEAEASWTPSTFTAAT
jgi:hypothetical protein